MQNKNTVIMFHSALHDIRHFICFIISVFMTFEQPKIYSHYYYVCIVSVCLFFGGAGVWVLLS